MNIKILDCTLRDGGYINQWDFGFDNCKTIVSRLCQAGIDYIETGFLEDCVFDKNKTIFNEISDINDLVPPDCTSDIVGMIIFGKFNIDKIVPKTSEIKTNTIRVTFKKHQSNGVWDYLQKVKNCGYKLFVNPTNIESYKDNEIIALIEKVNKIQPYGFSLVDTNGVLKEKNIQRLFYLIDNNLDENIKLCFHSHNNLQLSFSNAQCLIKNSQNRELIIDSTVFGMGRGAGNLCTELIIQYLNDNYNGKYDIIPVLKIVDEQVNPVFAKTPWGYSVPYYLAATNHCHPNYARYLVDKQTVTVEIINELLKKIPENQKINYDTNLIRQIYLDNFSNNIDDKDALSKIKSLISNKKLLVLAPGKSVSYEYNKIKDFIAKEKPFIVSLNFVPENYNQDLIFVTNLKRFSNIENYTSPVVITSNIENPPENAIVLNYSDYLNNSKMFDNVALMFFRLLINLGIKEINIAGLDGFSTIQTENYVNDKLINNAKENEFDERNQIMKEELEKISSCLKLNFITKSKYLT